MRKLYLMATALLAFVVATGCSNVENFLIDEPYTPAMVSGVTATSINGGIEIAWNLPEVVDYSYVQINFLNPVTGLNETARAAKTASSWALMGISPDNDPITFIVTTVGATGGHAATSTTVTGRGGIFESISDIDFSTPDEGGIITLEWTMPEDPEIKGVEIAYVDPREGSATEGEVVTAFVNYPGESYNVTDLFASYGEIEFTLTTVGVNGLEDDGQTIEATARPMQWSKITLTRDMVSADQSDSSSEGNLASMIDGNNSTYWSSSWHPDTKYPTYIQVELPTATNQLKFSTINRARANVGIRTADIYLGADEDSLVKVGEITDGQMPTTSSGVFNSPVYTLPGDAEFKVLRIMVTDGQTGGNANFVLAELNLYKYWGEVGPRPTP